MDKKKITPLSLDELMASHEQEEEEPTAILGKYFSQETIIQWISDLLEDDSLKIFFSYWLLNAPSGPQFEQAKKIYDEIIERRTLEVGESKELSLAEEQALHKYDPNTIDVYNVTIPKLKQLPMINEQEPDIDKEPMLDYIVLLSNELFPSNPWEIFGYRPNASSTHPMTFYNRYINNLIYEPLRPAYINDVNLMAHIRGFGLEPGRFWYLCLYLKDYVDGLSINSHNIARSPLEDLNRLRDLITESGLDKPRDWMKTEKDIDPKKLVSITINVGGRKKANCDIKNPKSLLLLKWLIDSIPKLYGHNPITNRIINLGDVDPLPRTEYLEPKYRIYHFNKLLRIFLNNLPEVPIELTWYNPPEGKKKKAIHNKEFLVSQMIYYVGIGDTTYLNNKNKLHDTLKGITKQDLINNKTKNTRY